MTETYADGPDSAAPDPAAVALTRLRAGEPPPHVARRLLAQGYSAMETTQILRTAQRVLEAQQDQARQRVQHQAYRAIVQLLRAGAPDGAIVDAVVALGVQRTRARSLVAQAQQAWHTRITVKAHALIRWLRMWCLVGSGIVVLLLGWPVVRSTITRSPEPTPVVLNAIVRVGALNVRSGPSRSYPVLVTLSAPQAVQVIGRNPTAARYKIKLPDHREGWVRSDADALQVQGTPDMLPVLRH